MTGLQVSSVVLCNSLCKYIQLLAVCIFSQFQGFGIGYVLHNYALNCCMRLLTSEIHPELNDKKL